MKPNGATRSPRTALVTGASGFIGKHLVRRLARQGRRVYLLCRQSARRPLRKLTERLAAEEGLAPSPLRLLTGDVSRPDFGLAPHDLERVRAEVEEIFHLAGVQDPQAPLGIATRANVDGTRHLLDVAERLRELHRVHFVSTIAVAGDHVGRFFEDDLEVGQRFQSACAETKYQAEAMVRARREDLPVDIYRPGLVVGDSQTGEFDRLDRPYLFFGLLPYLRHLPSWLPLFAVGGVRSYLHVVPVDYVVDAMLAIAAREAPSGQTYCLADPSPLSVAQFLSLVVDLARGPRVRATLPSAGLWRVATLPGVAAASGRLARRLGVPPELLALSAYRSLHDTAHVDAALQGTGLRCPPPRSYLPRLLEYYERERARADGDPHVA